jgi:hypothetical protein
MLGAGVKLQIPPIWIIDNPWNRDYKPACIFVSDISLEKHRQVKGNFSPSHTDSNIACCAWLDRKRFIGIWKFIAG